MGEGNGADLTQIAVGKVRCSTHEAADDPRLPWSDHRSQDTKELKFEHGGSHKHSTISRRQVPNEPGFAMTVHKVQGQTMGRFDGAAQLLFTASCGASV